MPSADKAQDRVSLMGVLTRSWDRRHALARV